MKLIDLFLVSGAALLASGALLPDTKLTQACVEKATLKRTIVIDNELTSTSFAMNFDGQDLPDEIAKQLKLELANHEELVVTDEYVKVSDGQFQKLQRTFDTVGGTTKQSFHGPGGQGDRESEEKKSSKLEGKVVVFTREADAFKVAFEGGKGDEELLEGLEADLELGGFLPRKPVADGTAWDVEASEFKILFAPGGRTKMHMESRPNDAGKLDQELIQHLKGKAHAKLEEVREEGGGKIAEIAIEAELTTNGSEEREKEGKLTMQSELMVEGKLVWDLQANRARSLVLASKSKVKMTIEASLEMGSESHTSKQVIELEGTDTFKLEAAKPD